MASRFRPGGGSEPYHAAEAALWLADPAFFSNFDQTIPELAFRGACEFEFRSPIRSRWEENDRVHGRLFRTGPGWESRPSVILLHGWNAELQYHWQFPRLAQRLVRAGVNAAMIELPYHCHRRPLEPGSIQNFISYDLLQMLEAARQSVADTRALIGWLKAQGSPRVGLWGISLGAWLTGLLICSPNPPRRSRREPARSFPEGDQSRVTSILRRAATEDGPAATLQGAKAPAVAERASSRPERATAESSFEPEFAVLLTPVARMDQAIENLPFCQSIRDSLRSTSVGLEPLNLASRLPALPPQNVLLIESRYDLFAPVETIEHLWRAWGQPEIWRLPHGHISVLLSPKVLGRAVEWVKRQAFLKL